MRGFIDVNYPSKEDDRVHGITSDVRGFISVKLITVSVKTVKK